MNPMKSRKPGKTKTATAAETAKISKPDARPVAAFGALLCGMVCLLPADLSAQAQGNAQAPGKGSGAASPTGPGSASSTAAKPDGQADVDALGAALDRAAGPDGATAKTSPAAAESSATTSAAALPALPRTASDGVRIVRLSQVKGEVKLDRATGHGLEPAFTNLPIARGQRLQTRLGVAEVEFEDNSSVRLTPDTTVEFPTLSRSATGATTSGVTLVQGMMFASLLNSKNNDFSVTLGKATIRMTPGSHIRLETGLAGATTSPSNANAASARLTVLAGSVQVENPSGTVTVDKRKSLAFDAAGGTPPVLGKAGDRTAYDDWDKTAADYHKNGSLAAFGGGGASGYAYGVNDLSYYGSFVDLPGCGSMWRPYFASAAFDPFANGVWAWYPGAGYSWVSPYPWGWTPFHSGSWSMCGGGAGGAGMWGWQPGGQWQGLANGGIYPTQNQIHPKPPAAPTAGRPTYQVVSVKPLSVSTVTSAGKFEFRNDSAGLGVPRDGFGKLNKIAADVQQHGTASRPATSLAISGGSPARSTGSATAANRSAAGAALVAPASAHAPNSAAGNGVSRSSSAWSTGGPSGGAPSSMSSGSMGGGRTSGGGGGGSSSGGGASHK